MDTDDRPVPSTSGGCGCGAVRWSLDEPATGAVACHCTRCQRRTGSAFAAGAKVASGALHVTQGEELIRAWKPDDGFEKHFCGECGSALFSRSADDPDIVMPRLGSFDGDPGVRPESHQFVDYAAPWYAIPDDGLPRFGERRTT